MEMIKNNDLVLNEIEFIKKQFDFSDKIVLEIGCGAAEKSFVLSKQGMKQYIAMDVNNRILNENAKCNQFPNLKFVVGEAQKLPIDDESVDIVFMFKSLHHVPIEKMDDALSEIKRVLKKDGIAYISEPVFSGEYNELLKIFHDEENVRKNAFEAIKRCVNKKSFGLVSQTFFKIEMKFYNFEDFSMKVLNAAHSDFTLSARQLALAKEKFNESSTPSGVRFLNETRVDILCKAA